MLLHLTATGWHRVHVPYPAGSLMAITRAGSGGIEVTQQADTSAKQYFLHYRSGHWSSQLAPGRSGFTTQLSAVSWAPGAASGWAGGEVIKDGSSQGALARSAR